MNTILHQDYIRFQTTAVQAYLFAQQHDETQYKQTLGMAKSIVSDVKNQKREEEYRVFISTATRCIDVLQKCTRLGLRNLEKRVAEYHLDEILLRGLAELQAGSQCSMTRCSMTECH